MKSILKHSLISGIVIFICSYGSLFLGIQILPDFFVDYINPIFNSDGSRNVLFYMHPFILALALAIFWNRFNSLFHGHFILRGIEFGIVYACIALIPILWITYSAMEVSLSMVLTWFAYGVLQSCIGGVILAKLDS